MWEHYLTLVKELLSKQPSLSVTQPAAIRDDATEKCIAEALQIAAGKQLSSAPDEAVMGQSSVLCNLRHLLGMMVGKFVSFYSRRVLVDNALQPNSAVKQGDATRTVLKSKTAGKPPLPFYLAESMQ